MLAGEQPWRERRWELLALAQYRCGRQRDALASIRTARRALGRELGLDPGSGLVELEQAILSQDPSLAADHDARAASGSCPWMGLVPYDDEHRDTFFGRREDVEECLRRLDDSPLLVLVGPSGCGKSSLMKAGIVPGAPRPGVRRRGADPGRGPGRQPRRGARGRRRRGRAVHRPVRGGVRRRDPAGHRRPGWRASPTAPARDRSC